MILQIDDWIFDIDMDATTEYSAKEAQAHCTCGYCRNFYEAVDGTYPNLRPFLAQFGLDIEAPEELMPFEPTNVLCCYAVEGRILQLGQRINRIHGITIYAENPDDAMINAGCKAPYFILSVGPMDLPWVLGEDVDDVRSPANEPGFFQRMRNRLLRRIKAKQLFS